MITPKKKLCDGCGDLKYIWKNSGGKRLCRQCSNTGVAKLSIKPTAKKKPIPPRSPKRSKEERLYLGKRVMFLQNHEMCMIHIAGICTYRSTEVHHSYSGKDRAQFYLDPETWYATCRGCHDWCHANSKEARELGFLK